MTVGEIAAQGSASARVLEKHGIQFCCSGQVPMTDACLARGLDPAELIRDLEQAAGSEGTGLSDWQTASLDGLIDHIVDHHHAYLKSELPGIQTGLEELTRGHSARRHDTLSALLTCFRGMRDDLDARLLQQETVLFPLLRSLDREGAQTLTPTGSAQVTALMVGHDATAQALAEIRRITSNYTPPADASDAFRALYHELRELEIDLHRHFHLENNILFPRVSERLMRRP